MSVCWMAPAGLRWWTEVTRACVDRIHSIIWVSVELRAGSVSALSDKTLDLQMQTVWDQGASPFEIFGIFG